MANIKLLDSDTINKIAAGEVVERPSSVVKELVENAIDAKATAVTIEIKDGGTSFIRITDNGGGIEKEDIPLAFLRHSTSKIKSAEDLLIVSSLGFRGEALSSIAAVAQVELITKPVRALTGIRYCIDGGVERRSEEIGCPSGTTIIVRNLFYNTPARRKFLKTYMTEAGYVNDLVVRLALSHPDISFKFIHNGQNKLHTLGNIQLKDIIYNVYGRDITANLLEVSGQSTHIGLSGYIGRPLICRGNRSYENYFINGRYIKSAVITKAIEEAYKTFIMVHKYPMTVLHLKVDASMIDVNVHPTKMEIRFNDNEEVYKLVYTAVRNALEGKSLIPDVTIDDNPKENTAAKEPDNVPEPFETNRLQAMAEAYAKKTPAPDAHESRQPYKSDRTLKHHTVYTEDKPEYKPSSVCDDRSLRHAAPVMPQKDSSKERPAVLAPEKSLPKKEEPSTIKTGQLELFSADLLSPGARLKHKLIGQIFDTYWIVEYDNKLFIIDQHAAHEKVLYEKLVLQYKTKHPSVQYLEPPMILTLSMKEEAALKDHLEHFKALGFEIEPFGGSEYAVRTVPMDLYGFHGRDLIVDMIDQICTDSYEAADDIMAGRLASAACKAAVKGNQRLSFEEADALISQLLEAENPYTCPHGRPTIISMTKYELEKKFKRIQ